MSAAAGEAARAAARALPGRRSWMPNMSLTLVRRVSAKLPYNHFLFRVDPRHTKAELREYLLKVYNVRVARITTAISLGKTRRVPGRRAMWHKLKDYKRAVVIVHDDATKVVAPPAPAAAPAADAQQQLR